jgi:dimethylamine/trimethylamine dehydrogenase
MQRFAAEGNGGIELYRTGDCVAPRLVTDCIFDGHRLAREIDSPNPAEPLPHIREHRILGATDEDYDNVVAGKGSGAVLSA